MINYCDTCANIRGMEVYTVQKRATCDLCGGIFMCNSAKIGTLKSPADAFSEKGYFNSKDLSQLLSLIKNRQSILAPRIKQLQTELSGNYAIANVADDIDEIKELVESGLSKRSLAGLQSVIKKLSGVTSRWNFQAVRETKSTVLQNLMAEKSGLAEKEKELSILYKNALDQILIRKLRFYVGNDAFEKCYEEAKIMYAKK